MTSQTKTFRADKKRLPPGKIFADKYKILEKIGEGGMGVVYKAEDTKLKRTVALKFLPSEFASDSEAKKRFVREAQAAAALDHPNICTVHEIDEVEGETFISMAYVKGQSLKEKIDAGPIELDEALDLIMQVCEGLEEAHKKGIVHRDIKSANIMLTEKGQPKIMDFGLAKIRGGVLVTREGTTMGTASYMSPEQVRGEDVGHQSDIWSLGVVLYEMIGGQLPFRGDNEASVLYSIVHKEPTPLKSLNPDIPPALEQVLNRALKKKPGSRYASAGEMLEDLKQVQADLGAGDKGIVDFRSLLKRFRQARFAVPGMLFFLLLCLTVVWTVNRNSRIKWSREQAIPEIVRLVEEENFASAYQIALKAEKSIPKDPLLSDLWAKISRTITLETDPSRAHVYMKDYEAVEGEWEYLGESPIKNLRIPLDFYRWRVEKEGYQTVERLASGSDGALHFHLDKKGEIPPGMVRVPGGMMSRLFVVNLGIIEPVRLGDFWIDKYEVTNRQFKEFMDKGGYQKQEYWKYKFFKDGRVLSWEEGIEKFIDTTGRPGPAGWEIGNYPAGQENFPVAGISWYEAAAYAEFVGNKLPTVYHWILAASLGREALIIPLSNFGSGPVQVGEYQGMSPCGAYDMAGNVREWCWNETGEKRFVLGGSWSDPSYMFTIPSAQSCFDRSDSNGFRCMDNISPESSPEITTSSLPDDVYRDYSQETPVSDEIFQAYKRLYIYEKTELDPAIESTDETLQYWIEEKITYNAAYGNDRITAYLYLPKNSKPPYQTVVYFPGSESFQLRSIEELGGWDLEIVLKSGRAVLYPIYKSTYERADDYVHPPAAINPYINQVIYWYKDLARSVDYLETRSDINSDKLAYFGFSLGAHVGSVLLAVEDRFKACIFAAGGLLIVKMTAEGPEVDQLNFAPRITIPTLMLNGRYDYLFPLETSQIPLYNLLGTPEEHKVHKVYESAHGVPRKERIREILDWLDRYLGPVE